MKNVYEPERERRNRKLIDYLFKLGFILTTAITFYLLGSLTQWELNPSRWNEFGRDIVMIPFAIFTVLVIFLD